MMHLNSGAKHCLKSHLIACLRAIGHRRARFHSAKRLANHGLAFLIASKLVQFWAWLDHKNARDHRRKADSVEDPYAIFTRSNMLQLLRILSEPFYTTLLYRLMQRLQLFRPTSFGSTHGTSHTLLLLYAHTVVCIYLGRALGGY
jgi:hypothetical protein